MIALIGGEIAKTGEKSSDCNIWWEMRWRLDSGKLRKIIRIGKLEECGAVSSPIQLG
jgi:hypothetical protein